MQLYRQLHIIAKHGISCASTERLVLTDCCYAYEREPDP